MVIPMAMATMRRHTPTTPGPIPIMAGRTTHQGRFTTRASDGETPTQAVHEPPPADTASLVTGILAGRKLRPPMPGDVGAAAHPDALAALDMLDKADQRRGAARVTGDPHVQSDR